MRSQNLIVEHGRLPAFYRKSVEDKTSLDNSDCCALLSVSCLRLTQSQTANDRECLNFATLRLG